MLSLAIITIDIDPTPQFGPLSLAWHGVGIAAGVAAGGWVAARYARRCELDVEAVIGAVLAITLAGIFGARLFYLVESGNLAHPAAWLGTRGFAFYGAMILGVPAAGLYLARRRLGLRYLDALAYGFPLGMAIGRLGDLINGEHYGPPSDLPWAIRYPHPDADVPNGAIAYHPGGLYEIALALAMVLAVWALRDRFRRPGMLLWTVVALYGAGRFVMFFYRSDSDELALGLNAAQWTSLALVLVAATGAWLSSGDPRLGAIRRRLRSLAGRLARAPGLCVLLLVTAAVGVAVGCGGDDGGTDRDGRQKPVVGDPGPIHVHGLGINPKDGALFIATHTGLFRAGKGDRKAERITDASRTRWDSRSSGAIASSVQGSRASGVGFSRDAERDASFPMVATLSPADGNEDVSRYRSWRSP